MPADTGKENEREDCSVFIVERDEALVRRLSELLSGLGAQVRTFASGTAALAAADPAPACVISELELPDMSGIELIGALRARGMRVPVILMAATADVATAVQAMRAGALDFIEKPHVDRLLAWHVGRLLEAASGRQD